MRRIAHALMLISALITVCCGCSTLQHSSFHQGKLTMLQPTPSGFTPIHTMSRREIEEELAMLRDMAENLCPEGYGLLLREMTPDQLAEHMRHQLRFIKSCQTADTIGSMLIVFGQDKFAQYGATVDPSTAPQALRELADRIEKRGSK